MCLDWTTVKLFEIISKLWRNSPTKHVMWIGENWLSWNGLYSLDWVLNNVTKLNIKERLWGWALVRCRSKLVFRWLQRNCIWNTKKTNFKVSGLYLYIHVFVESEFSMQYSCRHIQVTSMLNSFFSNYQNSLLFVRLPVAFHVAWVFWYLSSFLWILFPIDRRVIPPP